METNVKDIFRNYESYLNRFIKLKGWIKNIRDSKVFGFIELNDGSFFKPIQVFFDEKLENSKEIIKLPIGSAIEVDGILTKSEGSKQLFEIKASKINIVGLSTSDYPLQKKRHSFEYLRTIAHLRPRTNTFTAIFRLRSVLSYAIHKFFQERNFIYVHTPIITSSDCEGAGQMFQVSTLNLNDIPKKEDGSVDYSKDFFERKTNLTVSGQLEAEIFAMTFKNVYTFGPTFRAENSNTPRHAAEFWMIEPEIAFADLNDDMKLAEEFIKYLIKFTYDNLPEEIDFFNEFIEKGLKEKLDNVLNSKFEVITYTEAIKLLEKADQRFEYKPEWGKDIQTEHERYITEKIFKKPVFVIDYPKDIKAFYMRLNDDNKTVAAMDLLVPGVGEIIGGSQREERYDYLVNRIKELKLNIDDYWWYLELRKYGGTPHAGFGLGFERLIMYISGMSNIRDVIPFPRTPGNALF